MQSDSAVTQPRRIATEPIRTLSVLSISALLFLLLISNQWVPLEASTVSCSPLRTLYALALEKL